MGGLIYTKICPECRRKYHESDNFCSKHEELIKLRPIKDFTMFCTVCQKTYPKEDNFCVIHDEAIKLIHIDEVTKFCSACGARYSADDKYCSNCEFDGPLETVGKPKPPKRNVNVRNINFTPDFNFKDYKNTFAELDELLSDENIGKLKEFDFSQMQFDGILSGIEKTYKNNISYLCEIYDLDRYELNILDRILLFTKSFIKTEFKEIGGDLGHFQFNIIYVDDRTETALQISTLIHELAHYLLFEILQQTVQEILETTKTPAVKAYVYHCLTEDLFSRLMDEFSAHTVEGRYVLFGYQDYSSYNMIRREFLKDYSKDHEEVAKLVANTFAYYIKNIMNTYIDENMRDEIKREYEKLTDEKNYAGAMAEIDAYLHWEEFRDALKIILTGNIDRYITDSEDIKKMYAYSLRFGEDYD